MTAGWRRAKIAIFAVVFGGTIAAAIWFVGKIPGGLRPLVELAATIGVGSWVALAGLTAIFYSLDFARMYCSLRVLDVRLGIADGYRLTAVSYFVCNLTPTSDLNVPAMVYLMSRRGIPAGVATAASMAKSMYQVLWIGMVSVISLACAGGAVALPRAVALTLPGVVAIFFLIFGTCVVVAIFPGWAGRMAARSRRHVLESLVASIAKLGRSTDRWHLMCHAASIVFVFVYVAVGFVLARALGIEIGFARAIPVFSTSVLVAYLAPVPGSIGIAEAATAYLIDPSMPPAALVTSGLLRFLCWYLPALPGAALLADAARRDGLLTMRSRSRSAAAR